MHSKNLINKEKCDHIKIGNNLDLYHVQEESPGMIFWHNNGWIIFRELKELIRKKLKLYAYQEVKSPSMIDRKLWENTGHWNFYKKNMFTSIIEKKEFCIKPMNCPGHIQIFKQKLKSYRDLPLRIAEFGSCYRNELSGSLYGLMRLRNFTQDDAHIFCTNNQIQKEVINCIKMVYEIYNIFKFKKVFVKLSTRPEKYIGDTRMWNYIEKKLISILESQDIHFEYKVGSGVFYGPKIEFVLLDHLNRLWQCGTIQLDFFLPEKLGAYYIDKNNKKSIPIMIHRAILGSIERFIGILIEEYNGYFPIWLSPVQIVIMNITDAQLQYVIYLKDLLLSNNIRVSIDIRNKKISYKIREHTLNKIPYMFICGDREKKNNSVTVRTRFGESLGLIHIDKIIKKVKNEILNYIIN